MQIVPLDAVPNQTLSIALGGQNCQLNIYQKTVPVSALYMDVYVNNAPIILGVWCENLNRIVRSAYLGFIGDFVFNDTQGSSDPYYTGLGSRFLLQYLTTDDLSALGFEV